MNYIANDRYAVVVVTDRIHPIIKIYIEYLTTQYTHAHTSALHTQQIVTSTWLGDHKERPSTPSSDSMRQTIKIWNNNKYIRLG